MYYWGRVIVVASKSMLSESNLCLTKENIHFAKYF